MMKYKLVMRDDYRKVDHDRLRRVSERIDFVPVRSRDELVNEVKDAHILMGVGAELREIFGECRRLMWVQVGGAGVEWALFPEMVKSDVVLTNARGIFSEPIADHVFAMVLALTRGLLKALANQRKHVWEGFGGQELSGKVMGIVGPGGIGSAVARRAVAFGMRVVVVRRRPELPLKFADNVWGREGLGTLLRMSDVVAMCAPLTEETRGMIGWGELALMKKTAYLINVGRGEVVDEEALAEFLKEGKIAGAGLDVFGTRRPPQDSELWDMENVIMTPHMAGSSPEVQERRTALYCENIHRFVAGEPMINVVDKKAGY